jgi:hypothetical protein
MKMEAGEREVRVSYVFLQMGLTVFGEELFELDEV